MDKARFVHILKCSGLLAVCLYIAVASVLFIAIVANDFGIAEVVGRTELFSEKGRAMAITALYPLFLAVPYVIYLSTAKTPKTKINS